MSAEADAPAIEAVGLTKDYGAGRGVMDLDLVVERGEVFGFLGPNGAGKSTTIRILMGFSAPTAGCARILGADVTRDGVRARRHVGYVTGDMRLHERLTGRTHLDWLAHARGGPTPDRAALEERFRVDLDHPIRDLSRGNRQKIGIVQAFMHRPEVLILDEPTAGLDPLMQAEFGRLLREAVADGRTVFLSSHSLDEVQHVADRVAMIREARLVAVERMDELLARSVRRMVLRFAERVDPALLEGLPGVTRVEVRDGALHLDVRGTPDAVVKEAARHRVLDLVSRPADLEEIFLDLYGGHR